MNCQDLTNGSDFMSHWYRFLKDGEFDKDIFVSRATFYPIRNYSNPVKVLFIQGLQGSGKTSIAKYLVEHLDNATYIEQDMFDGDTNACLGALYHLINSANGPRVVIVSRCNINVTHYRRYLDMCHHMPTVVTFLAPDVFNPLYLMISLAGIFERSINNIINIDSVVELSVGTSKVPINDVISFLVGNYSSYQAHPKAIPYNTFTSNIELLNASKSIYKHGSSVIIGFVKNNYKCLLELRQPIEDICKPILDIINIIPNKHILVPPNPAYIGGYIKDSDREKLLDILNLHYSGSSNSNTTTHIHYVLQMYLGGTIKCQKFGTVEPELHGKRSCQLQRTPYMPGEVLKRDICALVIRKSDGASAFRLAPLPGEESSFHILCKLPNGQKASSIKSFINCNDSKVVEVIEMRYTLELIGFWKV